MPHESAELILDYLREQMPRYPFKPDLDKPYVEELLADFQDVSVLNEIKAFRWYYDNQPLARVSHIRVALRRWLARAPTLTRRPAPSK